MMKREQPPDVSITSASVALALLAAALLVAAHPVGAGFGLLAVGAVALFVRALWRQATSVGVSLPGTRGKLRVETGLIQDEQERWAMTVSITEK